MAAAGVSLPPVGTQPWEEPRDARVSVETDGAGAHDGGALASLGAETQEIAIEDAHRDSAGYDPRLRSVFSNTASREGNSSMIKALSGTNWRPQQQKRRGPLCREAAKEQEKQLQRFALDKPMSFGTVANMQTRWYQPPRKSHSRAEWSDEPQARQTACMAKEFNDELKFDQFIQKKGSQQSTLLPSLTGARPQHSASAPQLPLAQAESETGVAAGRGRTEKGRSSTLRAAPRSSSPKGRKEQPWTAELSAVKPRGGRRFRRGSVAPAPEAPSGGKPPKGDALAERADSTSPVRGMRGILRKGAQAAAFCQAMKDGSEARQRSLSSKDGSATDGDDSSLCSSSSEDEYALAAQQAPNERSLSKAPRRSKSKALRRKGSRRRGQRRSSIQCWKGLEEEVKELNADDRVREYLFAKYGSLRKAFQTLDSSGSGTLGQADVSQALEAMSVPWQEVTGLTEKQKVFSLFQRSELDRITLSSFIGSYTEEPPNDDVDWPYLTTMEKWTRWCKNTKPLPEKRSLVPPWMVNSSAQIEEKRKKEEKRAHEEKRMRVLFEQGINNSVGGLEAATRHLPCGIDEEVWSVKRYRREAMDKLDRMGKRIHHATDQLARQRQELRDCTNDLKALQEEEWKQEVRMEAATKRYQKPTAPKHLRSMLDIDMVNQFSEEQLSLEERIVRQIARDFNMNIPDVEALQAVFDAWDFDGQGVARSDFFSFLEGLQVSTEMSKQQANTMWMTIDKNCDGRINFGEYIEFHVEKGLEMPRLSNRRTSKRSSVGDHEGQSPSLSGAATPLEASPKGSPRGPRRHRLGPTSPTTIPEEEENE